MKTLVINKNHLNSGGIENNIHFLVKYAISNHYRVIWLASKSYIIFHGFKDIIDYIEIISTNKQAILFSKIQHSLSFSEDEDVTILSFTPFEHDFALYIKEQNPLINIKPLYILSNTKGYSYFIEEYFKWPLNRYVKRKMATIHREWEERDEIRYFTQQQRKALEVTYDINITDPKRKQIPPIISMPPLNENDLLKRAERKVFNIISITRFVFPHKQYLLGLVDAFAQLKPNYNNLNLYIIGYGVGESQLREKINSLPDNINKDIHLLGQKTNVEIDEIMINMHLNISVAGSVRCGARNGVVSLPARNFCEQECEVYGYLPSSLPKLTATEKGIPAIPFMEELIQMSAEDYITVCRNSYNAFASLEAHPEYFFEQKGNSIVNNINHRLFFNVFYKLSLCSKTYWKFRRILKKIGRVRNEHF